MRGPKHGPLEMPMRPPDPLMPKQEKMVREFLTRYRPPGGASHWTERHVQRMLDTLHKRAARIDRRKDDTVR